MLLYMYKHNILIYAMIFLCGGGIFSKIVVTGIYGRLIKAAKEMGASQHKLMKLIRIKFDACYKIKIGVNNVDTFVDKYVYGYKFCGLTLYTWENIGGKMLIISGLIALCGSVYAYYAKFGQDVILSTLVCGGIVSLTFIAIEILLSLPAKRNLLRIHMKDYLENNLKAKLENEYFMPEEMEEYRNHYFAKKEQKMQAVEKTAETANQFNKEDEKIIEEILNEYFV